MAVDARASDFASIIDRIEAESFRRSRSGQSASGAGYALVCRKEYAPDSDEAAELV